MSGTPVPMASHPAGHTVTGPPTGTAVHAARPSVRPTRLLAIAAAAAIAAAIGLGVSACLASAGPTGSAPTSARLITVSPSGHP
jgi:hypothetical protein